MQFVCCDWLSCFNNLNFDILISNPPYIKSSEINDLDDEVKKYDPLISLDGGVDGLAAYRIILDNIKKNLNVTEFLNIANACEVEAIAYDYDPKFSKTPFYVNKDFVFTSRYLKGGGSDDDNIVTYIGNKCFSFIGNLFFQLNLTDILYTYIVGKTQSAKNLDLSYSDFRICVEILIKAKLNNNV